MSYITKRILTSITLMLLIYLSLKSSNVLIITLLALSFFSINEFSQIYKNIFKKKKLFKIHNNNTFNTLCIIIFFGSLV